MSKRSIVDTLDKLTDLVDGNNGISINLQTKLLRHVNSLKKKSKPTNLIKERKSGSSQFEKKMVVSSEMCMFAKWDENCLKSRTDVTKAIWDYVTTNNLKSESNRRICTLDDNLKKLLGVEVEQISYPQIQKYIGQHLSNIKEHKKEEHQEDVSPMEKIN